MHGDSRTNAAVSVDESLEEVNHAVVGLAGLGVALAISMLWAALRFGLPTDPWPLAMALLLAAFITTLPEALRLTGLARVLAGPAALAALGLFPWDGFSPSVGRSIVVCLGVAGAFASLRRIRQRLTLRAGAVTLGVALILGWALAALIFSTPYQTPVFREALALGQATHIDTLFHGALAQILAVHGVSSTGLDGVPAFGYHVLSHRVLGGLSAMLGVPILDGYTTLYPVVFVPLWVQAALRLSCTVSRLRGWGLHLSPTGAAGLAGWAFLLIDFAGPWPSGPGAFSLTPVLSRVASHSHCLAVTLLLVATGAVLEALQGWKDGSAQRRAAIVGLVAVCLLAAGASKISTLLMALVGLHWVVLRTWRDWSVTGWIALLAFDVLCGVSLGANSSSKTGGIVPFALFRTHVPSAWWPYYWIGFYWTALGFLILRLTSAGRLTAPLPGLVREAWRDRSLLDLEVILVMALVGELPNLLFAIAGGGSVYFSDVVTHLAKCGLLAGATLAMSNTVDGVRSVQPSSPRTGSVAQVLLGIALLAGTANAAIVTSERLRLALGRSYDVRLTLRRSSEAWSSGGTGEGGGLWEAVRRGSRQVEDCRSALSRNPRWRVLQALASLEQLPAAQRAKIALWIPRSHKLFGTLHSRPDAVPFLAVALAGVCLVDGVPDAPSPGGTYGYAAYEARPRLRHERFTSESAEDYLAERGMGGFRVLVLTDDGVVPLDRYTGEP